jgi:hypothetical protein
MEWLDESGYQALAVPGIAARELENSELNCRLGR